MTTITHPDLAALTHAVCQFPDDDTPRLVLADCLDEHGQHERAEFIRAQCELARHIKWYDPKCSREKRQHYVQCGHGDIEAVACAQCWRSYRTREAVLLEQHARSWGVKCPACAGAAVVEHTADGWSSLEECDDCTGTGSAPVEFRRGFVESVTCRMGDVFRECECAEREGMNPCPGCGGRGPVYRDGHGISPCEECGCFESSVCFECAGHGWVLTPWARGVLAAHPVARWEITDLEPLDNAGVGTYFGEEPGPATKWTWVRGNGPIEWEIPAPVYQFCTDHYDSPELARDALALAVGRVARRLAGLPEVRT